MRNCQKSLVAYLIGFVIICVIFGVGYSLGSSGSEAVKRSHISLQIDGATDNEIVQTYPGKYKFIPLDLRNVMTNEYFQVLEQIYQMVPDIACVRNLSFEQIQEIISAIKNSPDIFWVSEISLQESLLGNGRPYQMHVTYEYTASTQKQMIKDIEDQAAEILVLNDEYSYPGDFEQFILKICQWFQKHTQYEYAVSCNLEQSISSTHLQGPLLNRKAICSGYAKALCYILGIAGYDTGYCIGELDEKPHAWCAVRNGDAVLYIDPTACVTTNQIVMSYAQDFEAGYTLNCIYWYNVNFNFED